MCHKGCFVCMCEKVSPREAVSTHCIVCVCAVLDLVSVESSAILAQCARVRTPDFLKPPNFTYATHCRHSYTITTVLTAQKHTNVISNTISTLDVSIFFWEHSFSNLALFASHLRSCVSLWWQGHDTTVCLQSPQFGALPIFINYLKKATLSILFCVLLIYSMVYTHTQSIKILIM